MPRKKDALEYHSTGRKGKIEVVPTKPLLTSRDLSLAYSPGVAVPCLEIADNPDLVWEYTARANLVAVASNGTAVLGLGDIGALAGKPVMEGKGCLFKKFADIDVFDLEITHTDPDKFIEVVAALEPTFGGINLEDIKAPECFVIEEALKKRMQIPVFHDDQHGTAIISGAALMNACEVQNKDISKIKVVVSGAGASGMACARFYVSLGVARDNITMLDTKGVIFKGRTDHMNRYKEQFAVETSRRTLVEAMEGADLFLGLSKAGLVSKEMVASMNDRPIVFALANPDPEISYPDATSVRTDLIMATGRSDYPNQVNNVLGFPFIFRGALDVRAREINEPMKVAAAKALAALAREDVPEIVSQAYGNASFHFGADYIIPKPFDRRVLWWVAPAVAQAAIETEVARVKLDIGKYREQLQRRFSGTPEVVRRVTQRARRSPQRIVFPEGDHPQILRACQQILDEKIARPILLGEQSRIERLAREGEHTELLDRVEIVDPRHAPELDAYAEEFWRLRQRKGMNLEFARKIMRRRNAYGMMMVRMGAADGLLSGMTMNYPETIRPALQIIGKKDNVNRVTAMHLVVLGSGGLKFFADATINIAPDVDTLAEIAIQVADAVRDLDITPRVAMISYSNFGSASEDEPRRVAAAVEKVRSLREDIQIEGEMQADRAVRFKEMKEAYPFARLDDEANVLIFPNLSAANVAYRLMASLGNATAIGPILLGLAKPVTVFPRDADVSTIVRLTAFTAYQAMVDAGRQASV